jgi:hypothetical protein
MKLFKYISSEDALKKIASGSIKFATLDSLNDPTELIPKLYIDEVKASLQKLRKIGYTQKDIKDLERQEVLFKLLSPETMMINAPDTIDKANQLIKLPVYDNQDYLKKQFENTIHLMASRCGIFSVTKRNNCLPMWAHYSNNAEGFVVEYVGLDEIFCSNETGILNLLDSVKYTEKRSGVTFKSGSYKSFFYEKDIDWKYEQEMRVITNLESCEKINFDNEIIYLKTFDKKHICRIIFGWKVKLIDIKRISIELKKLNPEIKFAVASVDEGKINILND